MKDEDIHAFAAPPGQGTTPPVFSAAASGLGCCWAVLVLLLAVAGASTLIGLLDSMSGGMSDGVRDGWHVSVGGHPLSALQADSDLGFLGVLGVTAAAVLLLVLPVLQRGPKLLAARA